MSAVNAILDHTYKIGQIYAVTYSKTLNLVSLKSLDIVFSSYGKLCMLSNLHIHEFLMKTLKMKEKS